MKIEVKLVGWLQRFRGQDIIAGERPFTVSDLFPHLPQLIGETGAFRDLVSLASSTLILINDRDIEVLDGFHSHLADGDIVTIIPISHGG